MDGLSAYHGGLSAAVLHGIVTRVKVVLDFGVLNVLTR